MALDLSDYENKAHAAIKTFWQSREDAKQKQKASGKADQGERPAPCPDSPEARRADTARIFSSDQVMGFAGG